MNTGSAGKKKSHIIIFTTVFIDLVGFGIIIPLSPYLATQFGATPFEVGLLGSIYSLMQFFFSPIWGQLSDRIGRRPVILFSLFGAGLSYVAFAFATQLWILFVARMFAGIFGANISTAMAYIADTTESHERSKSMGLIGAAFGLGFIFGPVIGGLLGQWGATFGTEAPFGMSFAAIGAAIFCFSNFLFAIKILPESLPKERRGKRTKVSRWQQAVVHLKKPLVGRLIFVSFLAALAMGHMEHTLFLYVKDELQWNLILASFGFAYVGLMIAFTQGFLVRRLIPALGERKVLTIGLIFLIYGLSGIGINNEIWVLALVMTAVAIGNGLTNPSVLGSVSLLTDEKEQGAMLGVLQSFSSMARIIGPAVGGFVYGNISHSFPFLIAGFLALGALFLVSTIYMKIPDAGRKLAST